MKISLIVLGGLAVVVPPPAPLSGAASLGPCGGVACAAAVPLLEAIVPAWRLPFARPAAFEPYEDHSRKRRRAATRAVGRGSATRSVSAAPDRSRRRRADFDSCWLRCGRYGSPGRLSSLSSCCRHSADEMARRACAPCHARTVERSRWRDLAGIRPSTPVVLLESDHPSLLVTWGLTQPKVILPAAAAAWSEERTRVVLTHELAHIRRGDWVVQIAAELLRAVYWFNPLLWIACRRLRLESEHACDDEVMNYGVDGTDYATHLIELARALNHRRYTWFPAPAMARPSSLERRVRAMLNDASQPHTDHREQPCGGLRCCCWP